MTGREKLQQCYEAAFYPPRLHAYARQIRQATGPELEALGAVLDTALMLHLALPEKGVASQRALDRFALYQSHARAFGMVGFIRNLRQHLGRPPLTATEVPGNLIRDIALPPLSRRNKRQPAWGTPS